MQESVGAKSSFTVLGRVRKREKVVEEEVAEDWEKEVEGWGDV